MMEARVAKFLGAALCLALAAGCSKAKKGPAFDLTPVSGVVTLDGKPLADAQVGFIYQGTPPIGYFGSGAQTDAEGKYELRTGGELGAVAGDYKVTVRRPVAADGATLNPDEGIDLEQLSATGQVKESAPAKYTLETSTDLSTTVDKGKTEGYDFQLKSG